MRTGTWAKALPETPLCVGERLWKSKKENEENHEEARKGRERRKNIAVKGREEAPGPEYGVVVVVVVVAVGARHGGCTERLL